jgi:hypothetical protein
MSKKLLFLEEGATGKVKEIKMFTDSQKFKTI